MSTTKKDNISEAEMSDKNSTAQMTEEERTEEMKDTQEPQAEEKKEAAKEVDPMEQLQKEKKEAEEKYIRLYSEFENFRRRSAKERLDLISSAGSDVIKSILPVLDDFDRAIKSNEESSDLAAVKEGFQLVHNKLKGILTSAGLQEMESMGKPFDVEFHEALTKIPAPSKNDKGKVVDVVEKGYVMGDRVIRFAKVVIGE